MLTLVLVLIYQGTEQIMTEFSDKGLMMNEKILHIQKIDVEKLGPGAMYATGHAIKISGINMCFFIYSLSKILY